MEKSLRVRAQILGGMFMIAALSGCGGAEIVSNRPDTEMVLSQSSSEKVAETGGLNEDLAEETAEEGSKTGSETGPETELKTGSETGLETDLKTGPKTELETKLKTGSKTGPETELETESEIGPKTGAKIESETGSEAGSKTGPETVFVENTDIQTAAKSWAEAFCARDGKGLYDLFDPERREAFYEMEIVRSEPDDDYIAVGWSSPWVMDYQYAIQTDGEQSVITYYPMTSDPHRWVWKQRVRWKQQDERWYGYEEDFIQYKQITSAAEFAEAYSGGIAGTPMDYKTGSEGWESALEKLTQTGDIYKMLLTAPDLAAEYLLNLHGGQGEAKEKGEKKTLVTYQFADDSQISVIMRQSETGEIWLPDDIGENTGDSSQHFSSKKQMRAYMTFRLPAELYKGEFDADLGDGGGCLFFTSDPDDERKLETLSKYVDQEAVPAEWRSAGAAIRYGGGWKTAFENGCLINVEIPWNHSSYASEKVFLVDCEVPALEVLSEHDMYNGAALAETEEKYGPVPEELRTSRMWYVFFAKQDSHIVYAICLNADLYSQEDARQMARSVHFQAGAWDETAAAE